MMSTVRSVPNLKRAILAVASCLLLALGGCALEAGEPGDTEAGELREPLEESQTPEAPAGPDPGADAIAGGPEGEPDPYPWRLTESSEPRSGGPCPWDHQVTGSRP